MLRELRNNRFQKGVAEMIMLGYMSGSTLINKIRKKCIHKKLEVAQIENKLREPIEIFQAYVQQHAQQRPLCALVRRSDRIVTYRARRYRGTPKQARKKVIKKDIGVVNLTMEIALNQVQ